MNRLFLETVSSLLWSSLTRLMSIEEFNTFRIVGGTSLSLQLGHRESVDIDLFTDVEYGSLDFSKLEQILRREFSHVDFSLVEMVGLGKSYFVGNDQDDLVKLDLFYTDKFAFPCLEKESIRFASIEEIAAMKLEVVSSGGRKKDFWDIHELLSLFSYNEIFNFYTRRYPYGITIEEMTDHVLDFSQAEDDFTPNCYRDKEWEIIKLEIEEHLTN